MAIYTAAGPSYKNGYIHCGRFHCKMAIYKATDPSYKIVIHTDIHGSRFFFILKVALYTATGPTYKMAIYTAAVLLQKMLYSLGLLIKWLYTQLPGQHIKSYIHV